MFKELKMNQTVCQNRKKTKNYTFQNQQLKHTIGIVFGHLRSDEVNRSGSGDESEGDGFESFLVFIRRTEGQTELALVVAAEGQAQDRGGKLCSVDVRRHRLR